MFQLYTFGVCCGAEFIRISLIWFDWILLLDISLSDAERRSSASRAVTLHSHLLLFPVSLSSPFLPPSPPLFLVFSPSRSSSLETEDAPGLVIITSSLFILNLHFQKDAFQLSRQGGTWRLEYTVHSSHCSLQYADTRTPIKMWVSVCVCLRGDDEEDLITSYGVLFSSCWDVSSGFTLEEILPDNRPEITYLK